MASYPNPRGPVPKPASKRRRANRPKGYGAATPVTAPAADVQFRDLGLDDPHPLIVSMWEAIQTSAEGRFWSAADWERARMEMFYADATLRNPTAAAWDRVQKGLSDLLISPAAKRRAAIELKAAAVDADEEAAVSMMSGYKAKLQSVKTE